MPQPPQKLRKQYRNDSENAIVLRFEDGHEIAVPRRTGKSFDAYSGEKVKVLAVLDKQSGERDLIETRRADDFEDA